MASPKDTRHTVRDLNVSVPFISNLPYDLSSYVEPSFRANRRSKSVFLIEPTSIIPEQKEKVSNSRVDFSLK